MSIVEIIDVVTDKTVRMLIKSVLRATGRLTEQLVEQCTPYNGDHRFTSENGGDDNFVDI